MEGPTMRSASASVKRDLRQEVTDSIIAALEKGVAPWQKPWKPGAFEMPMNPTSGKPYRGGNAIHLMVVGMRQSYEDPRWLTYRQARENGWQVRRGEKGTQIEFWQFPDSKIAARDIRRDSEVSEDPDVKSTTSGPPIWFIAFTPFSMPSKLTAFRSTHRNSVRNSKSFK